MRSSLVSLGILVQQNRDENPSRPVLQGLTGMLCLASSPGTPTMCQTQQQGWGHGWTSQTHATPGENNPCER